MSASWAELARNLQLRRNLQAALFPADQIGCKCSPARHESQAAFDSRIRASRRSHEQWAKDLKATHKVRTRAAVEKKIQELQQAERELWRQLRPDLEGTSFHN